ncbi:HNH endonuclease signature motif containing protein, partial [Serratia sp. IR-2025]
MSGKGQQVGDGWLNTAGQELGSPVPSQIADKLRGREFASFDAFRKAFWTEVGKDPELSKQFDPGSLATMKNGRAPYVRKAERVGKRVKAELHHVQPIGDDGAVYNVDNLGVVTPKRHI